MEVKVVVTGPTLRRLYEQLTEEYYGEEEPEEPWLFDPVNASEVARAREFIDSHYSADVDAVPSYETLSIEGLAENEPEDFPHLLPLGLADKEVRADQTRARDAIVTCPACGNRFVDPEFAPVFDERRLPKKALFSLDGALKLFARSRFVRDFGDLGLTGLAFEDCGVDLYRVHVECHKWGDTTGVCDRCGMKTNVQGAACFNLREEYLYDFQYMRLNPGVTPHLLLFVVTPRAMRLMQEYTEAFGEITYCFGAAVPGMMEELIWPQDKLYTNGEMPETVFRDPL